jgi:hypothetical protein
MNVDKYLQQKAVYWGSPIQGAFGGKTFADPVEIDCRWRDRREIFQLANGEQVVSRAVILVDRDVDEQGMLYLGELDDLESSQQANPMTISRAYPIRRFDKIPDRTASNFLRKAYL